MNITNNVIIFSVDRNVSFSVNDAARMDAEASLKKLGIDFRLAEGFYKGNAETSFVVVLPEILSALYADSISVIERLCADHMQECYLYVDSNQKATLIYTNGNGVKSVGKLVNTTQADALQKEAYTKLEGKYYITKE